MMVVMMAMVVAMAMAMVWVHQRKCCAGCIKIFGSKTH